MVELFLASIKDRYAAICFLNAAMQVYVVSFFVCDAAMFVNSVSADFFGHRAIGFGAATLSYVAASLVIFAASDLVSQA